MWDNEKIMITVGVTAPSVSLLVQSVAHTLVKMFRHSWYTVARRKYTRSVKINCQESKYKKVQSVQILYLL